MTIHSDGWQQEGSTKFCVGSAFFRSSSKIGRDLAVLAAIAHKASCGSLRVLDAMTGCGVRPLRYVLEANADFVWANEGNWELHDLLQANLSATLQPHQYCITHQDANATFFVAHQQKDFYDLIDIDSFGSPMPTLATCLWAVKLGGLVYLTSTDGRATSGSAPEKSLQTYGAYARSHPSVHEQGLRLLIGTVVQQAAARGLGAQPVFSWYHGDVNRVMVRITRQSKWNTAHYGFLRYCHSCGQFQTVSWKKLGRPVTCQCRAEGPPVISGPMWLGPLHSREDLATMASIAATCSTPHTWETCQKTIAIMQAEIDLPPYYYPLAEIGRRGKIDIPPKQRLIERLQAEGFNAADTHIDTQAIKTNAPIDVCVQLARNCHNN
ncbi:MAG: tRNA (guanine-N1)-methyltransferase [Cyanobacteria bacterium P01_C01_bin.121]